MWEGGREGRERGRTFKAMSASSKAADPGSLPWPALAPRVSTPCRLRGELIIRMRRKTMRREAWREEGRRLNQEADPLCSLSVSPLSRVLHHKKPWEKICVSMALPLLFSLPPFLPPSCPPSLPTLDAQARPPAPRPRPIKIDAGNIPRMCCHPYHHLYVFAMCG